MFDEFYEWLRNQLADMAPGVLAGSESVEAGQTNVPAGTVIGIQYSRGQWIDNPALDDSYICSIRSAGGPSPDVDDRRPRFQVMLLGPRDGRQFASRISDCMEGLMQRSLTEPPPCGAASIRAINEPVGPGYTTENRAWYSLDFQLTF